MTTTAIIYLGLMIVCVFVFLYSWIKISEYFKEDIKWAVMFVPLSLFFDVVEGRRGNVLRIVNIVAMFFGVAFAILFSASLK